MGRTTQAELRAVFGALVEQRRRVGLDVRGWELSRWAPGDGHAYWRIESDGGSRHPMGARQRSASELVDAMRFAFATLCDLPDVSVEPVARCQMWDQRHEDIVRFGDASAEHVACTSDAAKLVLTETGEWYVCDKPEHVAMVKELYGGGRHVTELSVTA